MPDSVRDQWKLTAPLYDDIREASDTPERLDDIRRRIRKAFEPLVRDGVLGPDALPKIEEPNRSLTIRLANETHEQAKNVLRERVVPERLSKLDGPVAKEFIAAFNPPSLGERLFGLIAVKLAGRPTLTYEELYTTQLRDQARASVTDKFDTFRRNEPLGATWSGDRRGTALAAQGRARGRQCGDLSWAVRLRRIGGSVVVLSAAMFALIGYYIVRHEPKIANDLGRITSICSLVGDRVV